MVNRIEIIPLEVRGYGNIVTPKTSNDFIGKYNEIYTNIDGDFVLSYGGVMLKITSNVSNTIKGLTAGLNVIVTTRDGGVPVSGLTVDCSIDEVSLTSETTDSNGECSFNWSPQIVGDSVILLTITAQDDYAGLTDTKEVTIGLLLSFNSIMNDLNLEDNEYYIADISEQVDSRTQLNPFVKDVWVAEGGEPIVDEYGIIHLAKKGDVIVEQDSLDQSLEYDNVIFEGDVELLTGAVYDMSLTEDYELVLDCLERDDIIGASGLISLTASQTSVTYGSSVPLTATVIDGDTPVSGETVTFYDGETLLGSDTTDSDGVATLSTSSLSIGSHSCTAVYDESTSNAVNVTVNKITSTLSLSAASSTITYGGNVSLSGTLSVGSGESVKIYNGNTLIDTVTTSTGGAFTKTVTGLNAGSYTFKATYEGDSTHSSVTSSNVSVTVNKATPTITLTVPSTGTVGTSYTVSGTLNVSGSVKLYEGSTLKDTLTVSSGSFSKSITQSSAGTYSYYAVFEATSNYNSVTSSTGSITVSDVAPSYDGVSLTSDKSILSYADSESATLTAQLLDGSSSASVSGVTVEFFKGSTSLGTATTNSSGVATKSYASAGSGDISLTAEVGSLVSETYSIEDCIFYDSLTTDKGLFSITAGTGTLTYSSNGLKMTGTANNDSIGLLSQQLPESSYTIECTVTDATVVTSGGYTTSLCVEDTMMLDNKNDGIYARKISASGEFFDSHVHYSAPNVMLWEVTGTTSKTIKFYKDSSYLGQGTSITRNREFKFRSYNNRMIQVKDLKVKPL